MLKKIVQSILAILMLVQVLMPTTAFASEIEEYEYTDEDAVEVENPEYEDESDIEIEIVEDEEDETEIPEVEEVEIPESEDEIAITATTYRTITLENATFWGNNVNPSRPQGSNVSIDADIPAGHHFVRWETSVPVFEPGHNGRDINYVTNTSITIVVPNEDVTITAVIRANPRVTFVGARFGTNWGAATYRNPLRSPGSVFDIAAAPPSGYRFVRWETSVPVFESGHNGRNINHVRNSSVRIIMPDEDVTITAIFTRRSAPSPATRVRLPGFIRNNRVELRRGPGTTYDLNRELSRGDEVTVLNNGRNGWNFVRVEGANVRGWVRASQIRGITSFGIVTGNRIRLRESASSRSNTLSHLDRNTSVTILGTNASRSWTQLRVGNQTGWVRTSQIRNITRSGIVTQSGTLGVHLRQGPGTDFRTVGGPIGLRANTELQVLGRRGSWLRVRAGNQTGWIQRSSAKTLNPRMRTRRQVQMSVGPGTTFRAPRRNRVEQNTRVRVLANRGSWSRVRVGDRTGWVRTSQLR